MKLDLANRSLAQKMSILVFGITLVVSVTIAGISGLILNNIGGKAKTAGSLASIDRLVEQGGAALSPVTASDGRVVGMLVMRQDAGPALIPASFEGQGLVVKTAETVAVPADPGYAMGAAQVLLLIAGILVFAIVAYVGTMIARGLLAPLGQLEKEVDLLSRGKTDVQISALGRTDEIGRIARSMARIQQSLIELARIKSQRIASQQASLVSNLKQVWLDIREAFRNAFHILGSDAKMIGQHLRSWGSTPSAGATRA